MSGGRSEPPRIWSVGWQAFQTEVSTGAPGIKCLKAIARSILPNSFWKTCCFLSEYSCWRRLSTTTSYVTVYKSENSDDGYNKPYEFVACGNIRHLKRLLAVFRLPWQSLPRPECFPSRACGYRVVMPCVSRYTVRETRWVRGLCE